MFDKKKIEFAVKAFIIHQGKFLIMHKNGDEKDLWELPRGRLEFGETANETVIRELKEETGLMIEQLKIIDTWDRIEENYQITGIIYLCSLKEGQVRLSDEHDNYKWIPITSSSVNVLYDTFKNRMVHWDWAKINNGIW
jgi:mutator protein MutT